MPRTTITREDLAVRLCTGSYCKACSLVLHRTSLGRTEHSLGMTRVLTTEYGVRGSTSSYVSVECSGEFFCLSDQCGHHRVQYTVGIVQRRIDSGPSQSPFTSIKRFQLLPLANPTSLHVPIMQRQNPETSEGHATRYCCPLQVNARENDGSQTRWLEKYRCKC